MLLRALILVATGVVTVVTLVVLVVILLGVGWIAVAVPVLIVIAFWSAIVVLWRRLRPCPPERRGSAL